MKNNFLFLSLFFLFATTANSQTIVAIEHLASYSKPQLSSIFAGVAVQNGAEVYKVVYNTTDINGNATVASGAMYIPWGCDNFPMSVYQHGTIFEREDVPSRGDEPVGLALAGFGYASIAPDYLGLGDNPGIHPYLHAETEATAAVNLLRAARSFISDSLGLSHNGELFITGYSQGGHAAMALHKYIEDQNLLSEFNVVGTAALSGPYNLAGVQMRLPADSTYSIPTYLPYLVESMQLAYGNLYTATSEYYQAPYDSTIMLYKNGTISIGAFGNGLSNNVYDFMQPAFLDAFRADSLPPYSHPFRVALAQNENYDWTPQRPIRMVYCTADEQVYYQNALIAAATMTANGAADVQAFLAFPGGTHSSCFYPALFYTLNWFNGLKTACQVFPVGTTSVDYSEMLGIYPNPTDGLLHLNLTELPTSKPLVCRIVSMSGQVLFDETLHNDLNPQLNLQGYPNGMYILQLSNEDLRVQRKISVFVN